MLERVLAARTPSEVVVATTTDPADDHVVDCVRRIAVRVVRGHATDLLDRHVAAARATGADYVVKIPSDCPMIDPDTIDFVIRTALAAKVDFVSNLHPPTWPDGFDVEVMTRDALETAWRDATAQHEREHTTPYIWDNSQRFRCRNVCWDSGFDYSNYRLTLDYPEDYVVIRGVYDELWSRDHHFTLAQIVALLDARPALRARNAMHVGTSWYRNHPGELRTLAQGATP
jgi:spore coat polysaccharide biosynthesis protein SpsF